MIDYRIILFAISRPKKEQYYPLIIVLPQNIAHKHLQKVLSDLSV